MTRGRSVGGAEMTGADVTGAEVTGAEMVWGRSVCKSSETRFTEFPALSVDRGMGFLCLHWRSMFDYFSYL